MLALAMAVAVGGAFRHVASYEGLGSLQSVVAAGGPAQAATRVYATYMYVNDTFDLVAIDPETGGTKVYANPVHGEYGAIMVAYGGSLYLGTRPHAHLIRFDPATARYSDLGKPAPSEQYIWDLTIGADHKLYGCTYPSARLVRYDPATRTSEDLGVMDPHEQYARTVAASDDGFVYVGTGFRRAGLVAYEIATGEHRDVLPPDLAVSGAAAYVRRGPDGRVYGRVGSTRLRLDGWSAAPVDESAVPARDPRVLAGPNRHATIEGNALRITDDGFRLVGRRKFSYVGRPVQIFRIGGGPFGMLYAGTILPFHFLRVDPKRGGADELGVLGGGEPYAIGQLGDRVLIASYAALAPLLVYDPHAPWSAGEDHVSSNPQEVHFEGEERAWRPQAMVVAPGGTAFVGALAGYGKLGGPLAIWNVAAGSVGVHDQIVADESVVSLAIAGDYVIGGTTVAGGGGAVATQSDSKLFVWDSRLQRKVFETVPVPGASGITDLITAPSGLVFGIAGDRLFEFDPVARTVTDAGKLPFSSPIYNSIAVGPDGRLWGLSQSGIFVIDPIGRTARLVAKPDKPITAGFALVGDRIYYGSGNSIVEYRIGQSP